MSPKPGIARSGSEARTGRVLTLAGGLRWLALGTVLGPGEHILAPHVIGAALPAAMGSFLLLGVPLAGWSADRLGRRRTVALGLVLAAAGLPLLLFGEGILLRFAGALAVASLPLEVPVAAWLRESVVEHRRSPVIGRVLAASSLGLIFGLVLGVSLLSAPGLRWLVVAIAAGLAGVAVWVLRVRTDPPVGHRLPAAIDQARWQAWLRRLPGEGSSGAAPVAALALLFAAVFLMQPVAALAPRDGDAAYWPWLLVAGALLAPALATRVAEHAPPVAGPALAGIGVLLGLGLDTRFFEPILTFLPEAIGLPVGVFGWLLTVAVLLTVGPAHLITRLPDDHRGDTPILLILALGSGALLGGTARILMEAWGDVTSLWLPGVAGFGLLGLFLWVRALTGRTTRRGGQAPAPEID